MTNDSEIDKSIEILKDIQEENTTSVICKFHLDRVVKTLENAREAEEYRIPKKVGDTLKLTNSLCTGRCPNCNAIIYNDDCYCPKCGQALDWTEVEE